MTPFLEIGSFLWSDHALVFLKLSLPGHKISHWSWRLNDNLLKDEACEAEIHQWVSEFVQIHETDTASHPLQRETLKCVLHCLFYQTWS